MPGETFIIELNGEERSDLYPDLLGLEVELDDELAAFFRLEIAIAQRTDGTWSYLDDDSLAVWAEVVISAGLDDSVEELMVGYVTQIKPHFVSDPAECTVEVWGMDASVLMDRVEKLKDWPNKKDSDVAAEVFASYGLTPEVEDTAVSHDQAVSTIIQRETDICFLKRLALRNGYECYVTGRTGYFRPPQVGEAPQPLLAVHFGEETNVVSLSLEVNALAPAHVRMAQLDRLNKDVLEASALARQQTALGADGADALLAAGMDPAQLVLSRSVATGVPEMAALCQGVFHEAEWFVTGEGEIVGNKYRHVLRPRSTVTIKGVSESHSGVYYVCHVTHSFTREGYVQTFRIRRNGLNPTGDEDFSGA